MSELLLNNPAVKSHMPFLVGEGLLLFCYAQDPVTVIVPGGRRNHRGTPLTYAPWTLAYGQLGADECNRIPTGLPADAVECSPSVWVDPGTGRYNLHFYGGTWAADHSRLIYRPYLMTGPALGKLRAAAKQHEGPEAHGFWHPELAVGENADGGVVISWPDGTEAHYGGFTGIYRLSYRAGDVEQVIVTGRRGGEIGSWLIDARTGAAFEIRATDPDAPVYKCTLLSDTRAAYTVIGGAGDDARVIKVGPVALVPVTIEETAAPVVPPDAEVAQC